MTRPSVKHDGFLVPNAALVDHPRMAEPDQIDFNTVAQARWGVVEGCLVTVSGSQAQCTLGGLALVNGDSRQCLPRTDGEPRYRRVAGPLRSDHR